jgi:ribosomal-protein-alanine N-acetyltransferase
MFGKDLFPILESERLILRKLTADDTEALFAIWSDDRVTKHMDISSFQDPREAFEVIQQMNDLAEKGMATRGGLESKETGALIGTCGINEWSKGHDRASIGYELAVDSWRQGYMTEVLEVLLSYAFHKGNLNRVEALVEPENEGSIKVLQKMGFQKEGLLRGYEFSKGRYIDLYMFSLLRNEYLSL